MLSQWPACPDPLALGVAFRHDAHDPIADPTIVGPPSAQSRGRGDLGRQAHGDGHDLVWIEGGIQRARHIAEDRGLAQRLLTLSDRRRHTAPQGSDTEDRQPADQLTDGDGADRLRDRHTIDDRDSDQRARDADEDGRCRAAPAAQRRPQDWHQDQWLQVDCDGLPVEEQEGNDDQRETRRRDRQRAATQQPSQR